jgi:hypothetical protein
MRWKIERTNEFETWLATLSASDQRRVIGRFGALEILGPDVGRPIVDSVKGSRHPNMKELRASPTIRVFFAFDPRRVAVALIGGDKAGRTKRFYRQMITKADEIYDAHLRRLKKGAR